MQVSTFSSVQLINRFHCITNVLEYKAALNLKFICVCNAMCSLEMSPFLHYYVN